MPSPKGAGLPERKRLASRPSTVRPPGSIGLCWPRVRLEHRCKYIQRWGEAHLAAQCRAGREALRDGEETRDTADLPEPSLGMRFSLSTPPGGGPAKREAGIGFRDRFQGIFIDHDKRRGRVVDG